MELGSRRAQLHPELAIGPIGLGEEEEEEKDKDKDKDKDEELHLC